jgi:hypothetical protein
VAVLLPDGTYRVQRRPHPWPRDAQGTPAPGQLGAPEQPLPGNAWRQLDGSWHIRLDPAVWTPSMLRPGDRIVRDDDGLEWTVTYAWLNTNAGAPDADHVYVDAVPYPAPELVP